VGQTRDAGDGDLN